MTVLPGLIVDVPDGDSPQSLADLVREAAGSMSQWSHPADRANVQLAVLMAEQIDAAAARHKEYDALPADDKLSVSHLARWCEEAETLEALGPKLHAILRDLGATPAGRKDVKSREQKAGRLAQLRKAAR